MHPSVLEKIEEFNRLYLKSANGQITDVEISTFLDLRLALRRLGYSGNSPIKEGAHTNFGNLSVNPKVAAAPDRRQQP